MAQFSVIGLGFITCALVVSKIQLSIGLKQSIQSDRFIKSHKVQEQHLVYKLLILGETVEAQVT